MAFRMLEYTVRIWSKYLADNHKAHELDPGNVPRTTTLPVVIPVVLHVNGEGATWSATAPTELADLYATSTRRRGRHSVRIWRGWSSSWMTSRPRTWARSGLARSPQRKQS